jgi:hypothetical protein
MNLNEKKTFDDVKRIKYYNYFLYWKLSLLSFKKDPPSNLCLQITNFIQLVFSNDAQPYECNVNTFI